MPVSISGDGEITGLNLPSTVEPQWVWMPPATIDFDWYCYMVTEDESGNVYAACDTYGGTYGGNSGPLLSFDRDGAFRWGVEFGDINSGTADCWMNTVAANGGVLAADVRTSFDNTYSLFGYDYDGTQLWGYNIGGTANNRISCIDVGPTGIVALATREQTTNEGDIYIIAPDGTILRGYEVTSTDTVTYLGVHFSPGGDLYVLINTSTSQYIYRLDYGPSAGDFQFLAGYASIFQFNWRVLWSPDSSFIVEAQGKGRFTADGVWVSSASAPGIPSTGRRGSHEPFWVMEGANDFDVALTPSAPSGGSGKQNILKAYASSALTTGAFPNNEFLYQRDSHLTLCGDTSATAFDGAFIARVSTERQAGTTAADGTGRTAWWTFESSDTFPAAPAASSKASTAATTMTFTDIVSPTLPAATAPVAALTGIADAVPFA